MESEKYTLEISEDRTAYEFYSDGPKGRIRKIVEYNRIYKSDLNFYNLSLGDLDPTTGKVDYYARSNNGDTEKILNTVAFTLLDFIQHFPLSFIYARGGTPSRTRLYQIGISTNLEEIQELVDIYGFMGNHMEPFLRGKNYEAFLASKRKKILPL